MRAIPFRAWVLAAASAVLQVMPFAIAGPIPLWRRLFCWFCLVPLLLALLSDNRNATPLRPKQTAMLGYLCGILWYLGNCYWIYPTMYLYGGIPKPASIGILILFSLYLGLYQALFGFAIGALRRRFSRDTVLWFAPIVWVAVELARGRITGFPWDLLGYTQVDNFRLSGIAAWTGVMGLSLLVAWVNVLWLLKPQGLFKRSGLKARYLGPAVAVLCIVLVSSLLLRRADVPAAPHDATAVLLQENLGAGKQRVKGAETREQMIASFSSLTLQAEAGSSNNPKILIWPEAPSDFFDAAPEFRDALGSLAKRAGLPAIADSIGIAPPSSNGVMQVYNSASFFAPDGTHVGRYDKMHLVPFGEYTPYKDLFFFAGHLLDNVGPFIPGTERQVFSTGGHRYGVFICYESIFGDEIRQFAQMNADVLVNISDDGWYGDTSAPWEHLDMVRMRAIENHRWILRATNTGLTASIDPHGRIVAQMERHQRGSIAAPFGYLTDATFYTRYGDWLAWLCALVSVAAVGAGLTRSKASLKA
jgi:apolipoprotein N-acyltransferase